jgi:hypothetical protein
MRSILASKVRRLSASDPFVGEYRPAIGSKQAGQSGSKDLLCQGRQEMVLFVPKPSAFMALVILRR